MSTPAAAVDAEPYLALGLERCYQCGKCTAGCPAAHRMDVPPNRLLRLLQLGREVDALAACAPWRCVSCLTCSTRCPQEVDCAGVMDVLRERALTRGMVPRSVARTVLFQRVFLDVIRRNGRLNELELVGRHKTAMALRHLDLPFLFKDALLAPQLARRGKLRLRGGRVRDRALVARIFERCRTGERAAVPQERA